MTLLERRGIPTVSYTAAGFVQDARRSAVTFGLPELPIAVVPTPFTNQPPERIRAMVEGAIGQVVAGLTRPLPMAEPPREGVVLLEEEWLTFTGEDQLAAAREMNERFLSYGWGDGLPLVPPTEQAIEGMLRGTRRGPDDVVAVLEPGFGLATVKKIAANAVMAGCRPEHLPVVLAAVQCLAEPKIYLRNKAMSTGPHAPLLWVNGPIRRRIGLNSGVCALGPGACSFANTVIGRAVRLCMMNIGHTYPGVSDMDTIGSPLKYSACVAENEEASPWPPYHVEHGFDRETSTLTLLFVYGICELHDFQSTEPERLTEVFATAALNVAQVPTGLWLIGRRADPRYGTEEKEHHCLFICPEHAEVFRRAGWEKGHIRRALHRRARLPFRLLMLNKEPQALATAHPELTWLWESPETLVPVLEDAECYDIVVVGGAAGRGAFFWGAGEPVTKAIEE
jgi:hypothetical protein